MNSPNINNIDKWLFESAEGTLSASQVDLLDQFMLDNPVFLEEQEAWAGAHVTKEAVVFPHAKALIKKPILLRPLFYIPAAILLLAGITYGAWYSDEEGAVLTSENQTSISKGEEGIKETANAENGDNKSSAISAKKEIAKKEEGQSIIVASEKQETKYRTAPNTTIAQSFGQKSSSKSAKSTISGVKYLATRNKTTVSKRTLERPTIIAENTTKVVSESTSSKVVRLTKSTNKIQAQEIQEDASKLDYVVFVRKSRTDVLTEVNLAEQAKIKSETSIAKKAVYKGGAKANSTTNSDVEGTSKMNASKSTRLTLAEAGRVLDENENILDRDGSRLIEPVSSLEENQAKGNEGIISTQREKNKFENVANSLPTYSLKRVDNDQLNNYKAVGGPGLPSKSEQDRIASNYDASFSSVMRNMARKIVRMMDNPIALKNSKDIYHHVPNMQNMDVNFASAGSLMTPRLQAVSRAQYNGFKNEQLMNQIAFDTYVAGIRGGIGVQVNHNYYGGGAYQVGQMALTYSPKIELNKNVVLEPGLRFKMGNKSLNSSKLVSGQEIELDRMNSHVFFPEGTEKIGSVLWYQDIGLSMLTNTKWFTAGVQLDNLTRYYDNVYNYLEPSGRRAGLHFSATLGTEWESMNKSISFSPYTYYQKIEKLSEIWAGSIFRYKKFTLGGAYSSLGDYTGSVGLKTNLVMLTYSADYTTSAVFDKRLLSHQLSLRILLKSGPSGQRMLKLK
jgi:type IX secretion system PorP/SprF family membrane protein